MFNSKMGFYFKIENYLFKLSKTVFEYLPRLDKALVPLFTTCITRSVEIVITRVNAFLLLDLNVYQKDFMETLKRKHKYCTYNINRNCYKTVAYNICFEH